MRALAGAVKPERLNTPDESGRTPLLEAVESCGGGEAPEIIAVLLGTGASPHVAGEGALGNVMAINTHAQIRYV